MPFSQYPHGEVQGSAALLQPPARRQILSLRLAAGLDEDGGEVECDLVGDAELVGSCGQIALLLEAVDAAFDRVAAATHRAAVQGLESRQLL
ncbi:hypothetical protein ACIPJS_06010 [Streptomyces sp. NPDC086783]|uniref:hypothetical protein n=1 Tax=Streptomyces sp. NPDC086783 TaxID=3365758 RepID=UPI00380FB019